MRVKRFVARTLPEAMSQVRAELGPEAVILHTQPVRVGGILGLFGQKMVEVTAAVETLAGQPAGAAGTAAAGFPAVLRQARQEAERVAPPAASGVPAGARAAGAPAGAAAAPGPAAGSASAGRAAAGDGPGATGRAGAARNGAGDGAGLRDGTGSRWEGGGPDGLDDLRGEVARLTSLVGRVLDHMEPPGAKGLEGPAREVYLNLIGRGVEPAIAASLARRVQGRLRREEGRPPEEVARAVLADHLGLPATVQLEPGAHRVVALVGPTGVGKTTTLAKLAAHWALVRERQVAVITADTYRIAAVEQLRTYCELIRVPLVVAQSPEDVQAALEAHRAADLVLVDTAGRSHRNPGQMDDLRRYLAALRPDETYLVLSLTASAADSEAVAQAYEPLGYDRLLFTKLDEAVQPGAVVNLRARTRRPLSYVTTGQNVPDDIEVASPERLLPLLLGGVS